jgi:protein SCO1/2
MKALAAATALMLWAAPASAQLTQRDLAGAVARPSPGLRLPGAASLLDLAGRPTTLAQAADGAPLVLIFADFTCRHLCGPGLVLTAGALHDSGRVAGRDYRLAVVGIDPKDDAAAAQRYVEPLGAVPDVARATVVLRGTPAAIAMLTRTLGYGYAYDAANDQYAHDASIYVFGADRRLAGLLPEMALTPAMLRAALAGSAPVSGFRARVAHLCYGFAALTGRFDQPVVRALQLATALALLAGGIVLLKRQRA